jgi:hypothetical protein
MNLGRCIKCGAAWGAARGSVCYTCRELYGPTMPKEKPKPQMDTSKRKPSHDNVNHPAHYTTGKIEVIDFIEDQKLPYHLGNAVKYIARAGKKDPKRYKEDLEKAAWYLNRFIASLPDPAGGGVV